MEYILYITKYYSAIKKIKSCHLKQHDRTGRCYVSKIIQPQKDKCLMSTLTSGSLKNNRIEIGSRMMVTRGGEGDKVGLINEYENTVRWKE